MSDGDLLKTTGVADSLELGLLLNLIASFDTQGGQAKTFDLSGFRLEAAGNENLYVVVGRNVSHVQEFMSGEARLAAVKEEERQEAEELSLKLEGVLARERQDHEEFILDMDNTVQLGKLASLIGHEVTNPAQSISLSLIMAKKPLDEMRTLLEAIVDSSNDAGKQFLARFEQSYCQVHRILEQSHFALRRLTEVTDAFRSQSRNETSTSSDIDMNKLIRESLILCRAKMIRYRVRFISGELSRITCFPGRIGQILMNLLANATDALERCQLVQLDSGNTSFQGKIEIQTGMKEVDGMEGVNTSIRDNGGGIAPDIIDSIFDEFFTTKEGRVGSGVGLNLAKKIVEEHQGKLLVRNNEKFGGAEFSLWLPRKP